jgi:endoribonuclease LACTB2
MPAPVHDAVTAVLTHGDELFLARRQPHLTAFPGHWAFPGGKVDRSDTDRPFDSPPLDAHPPRLLRALARELNEETGLDLEAEVRAGNVRRIARLGEATTPAFVPLRFRTWFFRIEFRERPHLVADAGETAEAQWAPFALWRDRFTRGRLLTVPPTRLVIERLCAQPDADTVPELAMDFDPERDLPVVEPLGGLRLVLVRSNTIPPADRTNAFLLGDEGTPRVLVDPSPADRDELERLFTLLDDEGLDEIFLTHHHPDHREFADEIARRYRVPVGMSADTRERIRHRTSGRFFEGIESKVYGEGDRLTEWLGEPVTLFPVPGHDAGQLALMPESRAWCVVSDLIQGVGTVVIGGPESSMRKYLQSLQRVIELDPAVVIPSHGAALGTTYRIRETLSHRLMREQQVRSLHDAGKSADEMVPAIYPGLDPRLLPLARMNVESHLTKLREDGVIA